jgi:hypothetical protein
VGIGILGRANRYLLPSEHQVITVRQHWALLIAPLTAALGGGLAAIAVSTLPRDTKPAQFVVWALTGFLILRFVFIVANWSVQAIVITKERFMLVSGLFNPKITTIALSEMKDLTFERSYGGKMLGYGAFTIESGGRIHTVIDYVPYSEQIYLEVLGLTPIADYNESETQDNKDDDEHH